MDEILDDMIDADTMEHVYLVKWKGYSADDNTWEPRTNLSGCAAILKTYEAESKSKKQLSASAPRRKPGATRSRPPKAKTKA